MEPPMIRVKESLSTSHLHSEKIRVSKDSAILDIKSEMPVGGTKFSSRYEIYNSTTKPFGKSYRELTISSSGSGISSCESHSSISSSGLNETTTYITCSSEIEPIQMTGSHCIDELSEKQGVSVFNKENYNHIHEATNYNLDPLPNDLSENTESDDNTNKKEIVTDCKAYTDEVNASNSQERISPQTKKLMDTTQTWSKVDTSTTNTADTTSNTTTVVESLKTPTLLQHMISDYEGQLLYEVPKSSTSTTYQEEEYTYEPELKTSSTKTVTKCRSMLNLELKSDSPQPSAATSPTTKPKLAEAKSDMDMQNERCNQEKKRIIKTISVMLENHQKQMPSDNQNSRYLSTDQQLEQQQQTKDSSSTIAEAINANLTNENVVLIEPRKSQTIDRSCRVTGEILKNKSPTTPAAYADYHRNVYTLPRSTKSHRSQLQRHFYYPHYVGKSSTRVLDEELPDPDKVRHARELFERVLKISALKSMIQAQTLKSDSTSSYPRPTPEIRQPAQQQQQHLKLQKSLSVDTSHTKQQLHYHWMDNGSVSSGVGSDISVETDLELSPKDTSGGGSSSECGSSKEEALFTSEEDLFSGPKEMDTEVGKPISEDVLDNIRAYGTSVTYYGGRIIASSQGYTCSPMTMTIMNEIKQSSPDYHVNRRFLFDDKQQSKFRLIKSNSCGSRLELSGIEEYGIEYERRLNGSGNNGAQDEDYNNNNETRKEPETIMEEEEDNLQQQQIKAIKNWPRTKDTVEKFEIKNNNSSNTNGWHKSNGRPNENSKTFCDMEFEEFQVLEESNNNANKYIIPFSSTK